MRKQVVKTTDGKTYERLIPETEAERRELMRDPKLAEGGIDERDEASLDDDDWSDV